MSAKVVDQLDAATAEEALVRFAARHHITIEYICRD